jgi:hypothetical protein
MITFRLKELMHSMGMSMVRERSVASFLERLTLALQKHKHRHRQEHKGQQTQQQRQGQGQQGQDWSNITLKAGWIELRKVGTKKCTALHRTALRCAALL